jgi:hypothetical protein
LLEFNSMANAKSPVTGKRLDMQHLPRQRPIIGPLLALGLALVFPSGARTEDYTFIKIAETAPGGFVSFSNLAPSVNATGTVAFRSEFVGVQGIYTGEGGPTTTIIDTNGATFGAFGGDSPMINAAGTIAFQASRKAEAGGGTGIFTVSGGATTNIALSGASGGGVFTGFSSSISINDAGTAAFYATRNVAVGGGDGIFIGSGGAVTPVALSTDPDFTGFGGGFAPMINAAGAVVFTAGIEGSPTSNSGVFARNGGTTTEIARNLESFSSFRDPAINADGKVAFVATLTDLQRGVYVGSGGSPTNIVDSGNPGAPATLVDSYGPYSNQILGGPSINAAGKIVFSVGFDTGIDNYGLFTGPNQVTDKVIRTGDPLFGSTVVQLSFGRQGLNDAGQIAFRYHLADGRQGIALTAVAEAPAVHQVVGPATAIPGGTGNFTGLHSPTFPATAPGPSVGGGGLVFLGNGAAGQQGIYRVIPTEPNIPGNPVKLADLNTAIPEGTGNFTGFFPQLSTHGGEAAVLAAGVGGQQGIYRMNNGPPIKVADLNTAIPGGTGNFTAFPLVSPVISNGTVVFLGNGPAGQQGVYRVIPVEPTIPGNPVKLANLNTAVPSGTGNFTSFVGSPAVSGDNVAFIASGGGGQQGVYRVLAQGPPIKVADTSTAMPGSADSFQFFESVSMDRSVVSAALAFVGGGTVGGVPMKGVYVSLNGPPIKVADFATLIPGGAGMFSDFGAVAFDPDVAGNPITAFLGLGSTGQQGIYAQFDGALRKVVDLGDLLGGKIPVSFSLGASGLDLGELTFAATFTDGSEGLFTSTLSLALAGDFNHDAAVDAADYVVWRKGHGTTYTQDHYDVWRTNFGRTASGSAGVHANAAVPEPSSASLLLLAVTGILATLPKCGRNR